MIFHQIHYQVWLPEGTITLLCALKIFKTVTILFSRSCVSSDRLQATSLDSSDNSFHGLDFFSHQHPESKLGTPPSRNTSAAAAQYSSSEAAISLCFWETSSRSGGGHDREIHYLSDAVPKRRRNLQRDYMVLIHKDIQSCDILQRLTLLVWQTVILNVEKWKQFYPYPLVT